MKKILTILLLVLTAGIARAWYFDAGVDEIPLIVSGYDSTHPTNSSSAFYSFFNVANLRFNFNINDQIGLKFRLKDTYFALSNAATPGGTNKIYIDRLNAFYKSDILSVLLGRAIFAEDDGIVLGNLADGLKASANLFGFHQRLYALYSGLLPVDINPYNVSSQDQADGAKRFQAGLVLEKYGLLIRSMTLRYFYSKDVSTNKNPYNPQFLGLSAIGAVGHQFSWGINAYYSFGQFSTNKTLSALAGNISAQLKFSKSVALLARVTYASGDQPSTNTVESFRSFGVYYTGMVLAPKLSDLLMFNVGVSSRLADDQLQLGLGAYFMTRPSTNDTQSGLYTANGATIGTEISGNASWELDPNITVLLTGGYFIKGNAFDSKENDLFKLIAGVKIKL